MFGTGEDGKPTNSWTVSPNEDFSIPTYNAVLGDDGITMCYQDLLLEKMIGLSA